MLARFVSADSVVPGASAMTMGPDKASNGPADPQQLNRFSYVSNNPVKNTDPTGHCSAGFSWGMVNGQCYQEALHQYMDSSRSGTDRAIGFIYAQADLALVSVATVATAGVAEVVAAGGAAVGGTVATAACSDGDCGNEADAVVRYAKGQSVQPIQKTYEMALDGKKYIDAVVEKYGINLRGSGQSITTRYNPDLASEGFWTSEKPTELQIGRLAMSNEEQLANTIAHELNHARSWLQGGNAPESTAYKAGDALSAYIRGER